MKQAHYQCMYDHELELWWYSVRRILVKELIVRYSGKKGIKILDVGCGTGALMKELEPYGEVYGMDMSEQAIDFCLSRGLCNLKRGDGTRLPYDSNCFDVVLALDVLEHIKDDNEAVSELYRVLKPGGICIVFVPTFQILWGVTDVLSEHFRRYRLPQVKKLLSNTGFYILRASYYNFFLFLPIFCVRIFARIFGVKMKTENTMARGFTNNILFWIFRLEIMLLRLMNFPFGVSALVVAKKNNE